jgi:glycosyltransferase involved in cell wall biosynthesis
LRVEIGVPTFNRPRILGRCLAALLSQTYAEWDLTVINDSPNVPLDPITVRWLGLISDAGHRVQVIEGGGWGQVVAHNWVLYNTEHEAILRLDDDIILNRDALAHLVEALKADPDIGAVAGPYFYPDERYEVEDWTDPKADGKVRAELNSHLQQVAYHFNRGNEPQQVEHLYSSCLYRTEAMKEVGGWPEVYSQGVACGEETEGTYKMHLAGWELLIIPQATGVHLWADGGIRSQGQAHVEANYQRDVRLFASRLPELRSRDFHQIQVGIHGQFQYGIGGAQRLFYEMVALLQQVPGLDVYPVFRGPYWSPDEAEELFGCRYEMRAEPPMVDVEIMIGHRVSPSIAASRYIQYVLFPDPSGHLNLPVQFVGISPFTSEWIGKLWGKPARTICPLVRPASVLEGEREKWILVVGRLEPAKAYKELVQAFLEMELEGWELHIVGANTQGVHYDYEAEIEALTEKHPNVILHYDIQQAFLGHLYSKASLLWAAKGIRAYEGKGYKPNLCEHYGYTPIEAALHGCVPIAFDDGGHVSTVLAECRWKTLEELKSITSRMVRETFLEEIRPRAHALAEKFADQEAFVQVWERLIRRVHGMALDCRESELKVQDQPLKVGCIVDHPSLTTGFGVVASQLLGAFHQAGYRVSALGSHSPDDPRFGAELPYPVWRCINHATNGWDQLSALLGTDQPDMLWICHDIGEVGEWVALARGLGFEGPIMAYFPVEGLPLWKGFVNIVKAVDVPVTWLSFGAKAIQEEIGRPIEWLPLGVDHAPFQRFPDLERQRLRKVMGWDGKFVVGYVARNKRVKAQWRLIYAASVLRRMGMDDLVVYLHCRPTEYGWNEGFDLDDIAVGLGVQDVVCFPPEDTPAGHGVPFSGGQSAPADLSLDQLYNCFDFYIHPSEAEGFGLPIIEAMACGVPVAVTNDGLAMSEVAEDARIRRNWRPWPSWASVGRHSSNGRRPVIAWWRS